MCALLYELLKFLNNNTEQLTSLTLGYEENTFYVMFMYISSHAHMYILYALIHVYVCAIYILAHIVCVFVLNVEVGEQKSQKFLDCSWNFLCSFFFMKRVTAQKGMVDTHSLILTTYTHVY